MKKNSRILTLFLTLSLLTTSLLPSVAFGDDKTPDKKFVTILFTHDLHDHFYPTPTVSNETTSRGGYAKLYTVIKEVREKDPELLLLDAGDFSMGSLFQTIFSTDSPQLRIMGKMGYDATTFGNHEFDFRPEGLTDALLAALESEEELPAIVASNLIFPKGDNGLIVPELRDLRNAMDSYGVKDYQIFERNGYKIGVFGVMGQDADSNAPMAGVQFENILKSSKEIVKVLREEERVDMVICLSHSGTDPKPSKSEDEQLAKKVPGIDVIISGHTHTKLEDPIAHCDAIIGSCGSYGEYIGYIRLSHRHNDDGNYWHLDDYNLIAIDDSIEADPEIEEIIEGYKDVVGQEYLARFDLDFDQTIAYAPFDFTPFSEFGQELREEPLGNLISDSYIYAIEQAEGDGYEPVDVAISPNGTIRGSFVEGNISTSDIFNVSSLGIGPDKVPGYPLLTVYLTGKELKTIAEIDVSVSPLMPAAQLYASGLRYTYNPYRLIFNKIIDVKLVNQEGEESEIEDEKLYRVAAGLYSAQMLSAVGGKSFGLLDVLPKDRNGIPIEDFEKHIIYKNGIEIKEWIAITEYLSSFKQKGGVSQVPSYYSEVQGNKILNKDINPATILGNPNKISLGVYGLAILILAIGISLHYLKKRRKREKFMFHNK